MNDGWGIGMPGVAGHSSTGMRNRALALMLLALLAVGIMVALELMGRDASAQSNLVGKDPGVPTLPSCGPDWAVVASPNLGTADNSLYSVSAVSSSDVRAVGSFTAAEYDQTLIEHWNGVQWNVVASPNADTNLNALYDVVAISSNNVWAVGGYSRPNTKFGNTLIEHWNGTAWSIVSSPAPGDDSFLESVDAISSNNIWAIGTYSDSSHADQTLIEHWNGTAWSVVSSPSVASANNYMNAVSAVGSSNVWAAGYTISTTGSGDARALVERWNGTSWSIVTALNVSNANTFVTDIAALSASDVWLVGYYVSLSDSVYHTFTEHWDGSTWAIISSPNMGPQFNKFKSVSALSTNNVRAVGEYTTALNVTKTLIEHWNGTTWSVVDSPNPSSNANTLLGVYALSSSDVWAVGYFSGNPGLNARTLTEHLDTCSGTPTPSPTPVSCALQFTDVPNPSTYYVYVQCLACRGIISGYACGGTGEPCDPAHDPYFRPNANVTRGQIAKIVALTAGIGSQVSGQTFEDVPPGSTFYTYTEQLYGLGVMNGYACGGVGELCGPGSRPYFRPNSNATRGQLAKIDALTAGYIDAPTGQTFEDVAPASTFYTYTQRLTSRGVMNGYPCGNPEPCMPPSNLPYFRPNSYVTRGQTSKIVGNTFYPNCQQALDIRR
jgi:hypothetical protein